MENIFCQRVDMIRREMANKGWDAVIITGSDPHGSEYPAPRWKQVEWVSGFTGEAGDIVITLDHAGLWTDTRYFIQANIQLEGTGIVLHKTRVPEQVLIPDWLADKFKGRNTVNIALDGLCQSASAVEELKSLFCEETELHIISVPDFLDAFWENRPPVPATPIFEIPTETAGESSDDKVEWIRQFIKEKGCECILLTALDEIAWVLNTRASDIEYNPLVISYLIISSDDIKWFVRDSYDDIYLALSEIRGRIYSDPQTLNYHLFNIIDKDKLVTGPSPIQLRKAVKNETEIQGMRKAHLADGVAMEKFLYWLETSLENGETITEWDAAVKLGEFRSRIEAYRGDSFETISAYGQGAALPHYITPRHDSPVIQRKGLYLCDSGGQFDYGTTDITRTIPLGPCTALEIEDYTLVLKGHIDLAMAKFPKGTKGCQIDVLAREPLWKAKRNFGHGTGHGVGFFLGVHEGPQDIRQNLNPQAILPGMITSNEPGIYREGLHGVRHENLILCKEAGSNEFAQWLEFETLTLCHFDTSAVRKDLLDKYETDWLNDYNRTVYEKLSPWLPEEVNEWLKIKTAPI